MYLFYLLSTVPASRKISYATKYPLPITHPTRRIEIMLSKDLKTRCNLLNAYADFHNSLLPFHQGYRLDDLLSSLVCREDSLPIEMLAFILSSSSVEDTHLN